MRRALFLGCLMAPGLVLSGRADVMRTDSAPAIDGRLDDACWRNVRWTTDFVRLAAYAKTEPPPPKTAFAFVTDERCLYFAARCTADDIGKVRALSVFQPWYGNNIELFLSPDGTPDNYYHFSVSPNSKAVDIGYYAEGGGISPDPYAPAWRHACAFEEDAWTLEIAIPYSAFYMTRNELWRTTWLVNVVRTIQNPRSLASWSPLEVKFHEPKRFRRFSGFPRRAEADDVVVRQATAEMDGPGEGGIRGQLKLDLHVALGGDYEIETSSGAKERMSLKAGDGVVSVPCVYAANGRALTHIALRNLSDGSVAERDYPVIVDYAPLKVVFSRPQYRDCFYPGQCADRVEGRLRVAGSASAKLTLEGPGFPRRTAVVDGEGDFAFDTRGFGVGEAWLTVEAGDLRKRFRIRNLPATGHDMVWIEDGHLVLNGKRTIRRNIYASTYSIGRAQRRRYDADLKSFSLTPVFERNINLEYHRYAAANSGRASAAGFAAEGRECTVDHEPDPAYLDYLRGLYEANRDRDFGCYYIADEPECRGISPIWLRHVYRFMSELDPYHPLFLSSRAGRTYVECADWLETHPYLNCGWTDDGRRRYGIHPKDVGRYVAAFGVEGRPDKCVGFLPTCFAYRDDAYSNDYPTFDEYVVHVWCALLRGAQSLWPYAGHDMGDRPATYEGVRYCFQSVAALEDFLTSAARTALATPADAEGMLFKLPNGERLLVVANYSDRPQTVRLDGVSGTFREFRGNRVLDLSIEQPNNLNNRTILLQSLETFIATTSPRDEGLEPLALVRARVDREEAARKGRDNQLRGRYEATEFKTNMRQLHGGLYKLIDGTLNVQSPLYAGTDPTWLEFVCKGYEPTFDRLLLWGDGVKDVSLSVLEDGVWKRLEATVTREGLKTELAFVVRHRGTRFRLDFPADARHPVDFELYEVEIPRVK